MISTASKLKSKGSTVVFFQDDASAAQLNAALPAHLVDLINDYKKAKKSKENSTRLVQLTPSATSDYVVLANLGKAKDTTIKRFRSLVASATRSLQHQPSVQWVVAADVPNFEHHIAQVIQMVTYKVPHSKSAKDDPAVQVNHAIIGAKKQSVLDGEAVGSAVNKARSFANMPANLLTTEVFVKDIKALFKGDKRYKVTILNESEMKKKKMHALLGVGQGSKYPSYLVDIEYNGGAGEHVALVGKGVMFDTGGISIKPSGRMKEMKGDMGGAAAVVAAAWGAGQLNIKRKVSFIVPIVENMVGKDAQRPGDVVVASNGTSIEITNTDAEGRLILADALVYACKKKVKKVVDIATLTGASVIALGPYAVSVLGNNQAVVDALISGGNDMNEPLWQLPLFDEYKDLLKSDVADILNANEGREAGTITAAKFLEQFVGDTPWAHLDIASTMSVSSNKGEHVKGMTGAGTRALLAFLSKK